MTAYSYGEDGQYIGESLCQIDPRATKRIGETQYLIPANATLIPPPEFDKTKKNAFFRDGAWFLEDLPPEPEPIDPSTLPPTEFEQLRADVDFIAAMNGIIL